SRTVWSANHNSDPLGPNREVLGAGCCIAEVHVADQTGLGPPVDALAAVPGGTTAASAAPVAATATMVVTIEVSWDLIGRSMSSHQPRFGWPVRSSATWPTATGGVAPGIFRRVRIGGVGPVGRRASRTGDVGRRRSDPGG